MHNRRVVPTELPPGVAESASAPPQGNLGHRHLASPYDRLETTSTKQILSGNSVVLADGSNYNVRWNIGRHREHVPRWRFVADHEGTVARRKMVASFFEKIV